MIYCIATILCSGDFRRMVEGRGGGRGFLPGISGFPLPKHFLVFSYGLFVVDPLSILLYMTCFV